MEHTEKCRGCIIENRCDYITCRIDEAKEEMEKQLKKEKTLLNHLLCWGYDPEEYLDCLDNIETATKEKEYLAEHPEEADEEAQYLDDDIEDWQEELRSMKKNWKPDGEPNMEEELELIKKWVKEREDLINEV